MCHAKRPAAAAHGATAGRPRATTRSLPALRCAAAAAVTASAALLSLVDAQRATAELLAIEILDGARCVGARHLDEAETARAAGVAIGDDAHRLDGAMLCEQLTDLGVGSRKRQVAHVNSGHAIKLLKRTISAGAHAENRGLLGALTATWSGTIRLFRLGSQLAVEGAGGRRQERESSRTGAD